MRRTITTLVFLVAGGLAFAIQAADQSRGNWQYYAAGQNSYRISDEDEDSAPDASSVAQAVGRQATSGREQNALYVADSNSVGAGVLQAGFVDGCGCNENVCGGGG